MIQNEMRKQYKKASTPVMLRDPPSISKLQLLFVSCVSVLFIMSSSKRIPIIEPLEANGTRTPLKINNSVAESVLQDVSANQQCRGKERILEILRLAENGAENACSISSKPRYTSARRKIHHPPPPRRVQRPRPRRLQRRDYTRNKRTCNYSGLCDRLPPWKDVTDLYGEEPVVLGLETCQQYRSLLSAEANGGMAVEPMLRVAGFHNSGTTALTRTFFQNLNVTKRVRRFDYYAVPWGKHIPAKYRMQNTFPPYNHDNKSHVLPIVIVRDPYRWMNSMCKEAYSVTWDKNSRYCPNLVRRKPKRGPSATSYEVLVKPQQGEHMNITYESASLAHLWTEWYQQYFDADFPRLLIRFEDTIFHMERVMDIITECAGVSRRTPLLYRLRESKQHGDSSDFISALIKYGTSDGRFGQMTQEDWEFSRTALNSTLMEKFRYTYGEGPKKTFSWNKLASW